MKRIIICLMALAMLAPVYADYSKDLKKAYNKQLKAKTKEIKKAKWEILGSNTVDVALAKHYDKLINLGEDGHEVEGISTSSKSKNIGKQMAINSACITYAQEAGSTLQGRVVSDLFGNGVDSQGEFENFYAAYERLVEQEIRGEMEPSYTICRQNPDGTYEVRTYFIVNQSNAALARKRALNEALKNSEAAQKVGDKISSFVEKGF